MIEELEELEKSGVQTLQQIHNVEELPNWYKNFLGKKGKLTQVLKNVGTLSAEERPKIGKLVNEVKQKLSDQFHRYQEELQSKKLQQALESEEIDVTLPGRPVQQGHLHLTTQTLRKVREILGSMGFQVYDSPDVESDEYNFQLLNIPAYHPARDMWDTFWINDQVVMRTHTSPGQMHAMREYHPNPIRVILPGKCYRFEKITSRSEHQFYQVEGLAVGHHITLADLLGTMEEFARRMYGKNRKVRIRGSYFPFTEPSIEIDMDCILCHGEGCRVCKHTGWLEVAGAGMIHPVVLENGGYDPNEWSGFAFGMGVERPAMLLHDVHDIRYFYGNNLQFLRQF